MNTPHEEGTVRITIRDVYMAVQELQREVSHANGLVSSHVAQASHSGTQAELNDHESRIRKMEKVAWMALGVGAAAGATAGYVLSLIH